MDLCIFTFPNLRGGHSADSELDAEYRQMHIHIEIEILYICKGTLLFQAEGATYCVEPGDMLLFRSSEAHRIIEKVSNSVYERVTFHVSPALLKETLNGRLLKPFLDRALGTMNLYRASELPGELIMACLRQLFSDCEIHSEMQILSYLLPILQAVHDTYCKKLVNRSAEISSSASQIVAYINSHLYELRNTSQLEEIFFLCESQINRIFHRFMGTSVWHYIKLKRLYAAREMMQNGTAPTLAAANCGYQDYSAFYRAYKKQFGHTPKEDLIKRRQQSDKLTP